MVRVTACVVPRIVQSREMLRAMGKDEAALAMTDAMWEKHANNINQKNPPVTMSHKLLTYGQMGKVLRAWKDGGKGYVEMEVDDASVPAEFLAQGRHPLDVSMSSDVNPRSDTCGRVIEVSFCGEGARTGSAVTHLDGAPYKPKSTAYQHILSQPTSETPHILAASIFCRSMSTPTESEAPASAPGVPPQGSPAQSPPPPPQNKEEADPAAGSKRKRPDEREIVFGNYTREEATQITTSMIDSLPPADRKAASEYLVALLKDARQVAELRATQEKEKHEKRVKQVDLYIQMTQRHTRRKMEEEEKQALMAATRSDEAWKTHAPMIKACCKRYSEDEQAASRYSGAAVMDSVLQTSAPSASTAYDPAATERAALNPKAEVPDDQPGVVAASRQAAGGRTPPSELDQYLQGVHPSCAGLAAAVYNFKRQCRRQ